MKEQEELFELGTPEKPKNHIEAAFWEYHRKNSHVYELFDRFTRRAIARGFANLGSHMIIQRIRWETMIETDSDDGFKINNNHEPYYARLWMRKNAQYNGFFRLRALKYGRE